MEAMLFYLVALVSVISAFFVTKCRNPINSALCLVTTFLCLAVFYVMLQAPFMAAIQIMVYAGAIMVLIIFVIMLLNIGSVGKSRYTHGVAGAIVLSFLSFIVAAKFIAGGTVSKAVGDISAEVVQSYGHTELIGKAMFTEFLLPFEIASILLLVAIVGAVILSKRKV
ncbi:MAG: NADH-quinone oxidoreductase subunit J [Desulfuromonas sp.]|nr:MAG: NADH-quinone oxidoreductase subunit J [Desulfuromonas sp.]